MLKFSNQSCELYFVVKTLSLTCDMVYIKSKLYLTIQSEWFIVAQRG